MAIFSLSCYCKKVSNAFNATQKEILDSLSHEAQIMQTVICQTKWDEQAIIRRWNKNRWSEKCLEDNLLVVKECSIPQRHLFLVFPDVFCWIFVDPFFFALHFVPRFLRCYRTQSTIQLSKSEIMTSRVLGSVLVTSNPLNILKNIYINLPF